MNKRGTALFLLVVVITCLGIILFGMVQDILVGGVAYTPIIPPNTTSPVCPGDPISYTVSADALNLQLPVIVTTSEVWCKSGADGRCLYRAATSVTYPIMQERSIKGATAVRIIPDDPWFVPGETVELWHATEANNKTTGYRVYPVTIGENCK